MSRAVAAVLALGLLKAAGFVCIAKEMYSGITCPAHSLDTPGDLAFDSMVVDYMKEYRVRAKLEIHSRA